MNVTGFPERKSIGILIDPDRAGDDSLDTVLKQAEKYGADYILAGGSITFSRVDDLIRKIKQKCRIPVILFPGNLLQLNNEADAIFLLSLISGRNPELLIGNHVLAAPFLKEARNRLIPVGYILINCGARTSVEYISQTESIPADKPEIVIATALAGEMLGLRLIYLEGGSGAEQPVPPEIISAVKENVTIPLAVGGGIRNPDQVRKTFLAGADLVIIGNGIEKNTGLLAEACNARDSIRKSS